MGLGESGLDPRENERGARFRGFACLSRPLSWRSAEEVVNDVRAKAGKPPLELAQTGGEGEVADLHVRELLAAAGWRHRPATRRDRDPGHVSHGTTEREAEPNGLPNVAHTPADPSAPGAQGESPGRGG